MKTLLISSLLGVGIFLTACETTVVDHRRDQGSYGYGDNGRYGYGDTRYHTQNVERTNVYQNNVYETNLHRNDINRNDTTSRTVVKTRSQDAQTTVNKQTSTADRKNTTTKVTTAKVNQKSQKGVKTNDDDKKEGNKKTDATSQTPQ